MQENRCKNCGGYMEKDNTLNMYICEYCGTKQAIQIEEKNNYTDPSPLSTGNSKIERIIEISLFVLFKILFPIMVLYALILCFTL